LKKVGEKVGGVLTLGPQRDLRHSRNKFIASDNMLCQVVKDVAIDELTLLNRAV